MEFFDMTRTENPLHWMGSLADQQQLEQTIFIKAATLSSAYKGGDWRYIGCGQNIVFMAPKAETNHVVIDSQGNEVGLSSEAFGLLSTIQAMEGLRFDPKYKFLDYRIRKLKEVAESVGAGAIVAFLDQEHVCR